MLGQIINEISSINQDDEEERKLLLDKLKRYYPDSFVTLFLLDKPSLRAYKMVTSFGLGLEISKTLKKIQESDQASWENSIILKIQNAETLREIFEIRYNIDSEFTLKGYTAKGYHMENMRYMIKDGKLIFRNPKIYEFLDHRESYLGSMKDNSDSDLETSFSELSYHSHKIVLLEKLGIVDFLKEKYNLNYANTDLAKVIKGIPSFDEYSTEQIRNNLKDLQNNPSRVMTDNALKKVKQLFIEMGIDEFLEE